MAVTLQFSICEASDNKSLTFTETTGAYSASNTSGWGSPNRATSDAETATLAVTTPDDVTTTLNLFTSSFPTTNDDLEFEIDPEDIGYSTGSTLPDGLYTFVYTVTRTTATSFTYTQTRQVLIYGQAKCSVFSLYGDIPTEECECNTDALELAFKGTTFLRGLEYAAATGNSAKFEKILDIISRLTANNNCNNC